MRDRFMAGLRLLRLNVLLAVSLAGCVGIFAAAASARYQANSVVPVFCTADQIPENTQLSVRLRWGVSNSGQMAGFLAAQKMTWTVYASDGTTVLATSAPTNPEYGDTTSWSAPAQEVGTITTKTGAVKKQKFTYSDYQQATGVTVGLGETVIVAYELSANAPTDDGFGWKFLEPGTISSGSSCTVTGVTPPTP
jgi:hypothetical protein